MTTCGPTCDKQISRNVQLDVYKVVASVSRRQKCGDWCCALREYVAALLADESTEKKMSLTVATRQDDAKTSLMLSIGILHYCLGVAGGSTCIVCTDVAPIVGTRGLSQ